MMVAPILISCALLLFTVITGAHGLECFICTEEPNLSACNVTTHCKDNEECFLEHVTNDRLQQRYNAGCRSSTICRIMASLSTGKRFVHVDGAVARSNLLVNCGECCNEKNGCNHQLCNKTSLQTTPTSSRVTTGAHGLECFICDEELNLSDCNVTTRCKDNEECFLERVTNSRLQQLYNAGCRSSTVCRVMESLSTGKRFVHVDGATSRRNLVNCAECCNEKNRCNHQLCNKTSLQTTPTYSRGHVCASCIRVANVSDCRSTICSEDEECFLEKTVTDQLTTEYNAGCRSKTICQIMEQLQGRKRSEEMSKSQGKRRTVVSCAECCADQDLCNKHLCGLV